MGVWALLMVATMPIVQVLIISLLGAVLASGYCNVLTTDARKHMNKIVFIVFTPSLMFANLAKSVTLQDIILWWFMPINIGTIFLLGGTLGWIVVKILKPERYLEGIVIAACSAGNFGNLLLIVIPALCDEEGSPLGERSICKVNALSYVSFSMALGGFYTWTHTYHLIRTASELYNQKRLIDVMLKIPNKDAEAGGDTNLLDTAEEIPYDHMQRVLTASTKDIDETTENQPIIQLASSLKDSFIELSLCGKIKQVLHQIIEELMAPPTVAAMMGFIFGATPWLKFLLIGASAPLKVIQDSIKLLGDGTIPCITLILGGNLTRGLRVGKLQPPIIISIIIVRYVILPVVGVAIVLVAGEMGFLSKDPLYRYVLMIQFTIPPAMNIGTMTQLFDVGQEECSIIFLWTYLVAAFAITIWSTFFMWLLF
ncbi:hypothetical protein AAC387_Pa04g2083 [Persea americana]